LANAEAKARGALRIIGEGECDRRTVAEFIQPDDGLLRNQARLGPAVDAAHEEARIDACGAQLQGGGAAEREASPQGEGKGQDFTPLAAAVERSVGHLVLIGEGADRIAAAWPRVPATRAATLAAAVDAAFAEARRPVPGRKSSGVVVLFSPGCSSFDMFRDYEDRGRRFKDEVVRLRTEANT